MASARPETILASVAPQENFTYTSIFRSLKNRLVNFTSSVEMVLPLRSSIFFMDELFATAITHLAGLALTLE